MAEIPDPDHHQINYFLAPGRSVHHSEIHADIFAKPADRHKRTSLIRGNENNNSFQATHDILVCYLAYNVVENLFVHWYA